MKKIYCLIINIFLITILFSCKEKNETYFKEFPETINMNKKLLDEYTLEGALDNRYLYLYDSLLIIVQNRLENGIFSIYSLNTQERLASFGKQGKGPDEFIDIGYPVIDKIHGLFWFIDYPKSTFYAYRIEDMVLNTENIKPIKEIKFDQLLLPFNYVVLEDTSIMIPASIHSDLCSIINTQGDVIKVIGNQPMFDSDGLPHLVYSDLHSRLMVFDNSKNEIVFTYHYYDKLLKYNLDTKETFVVTGPDNIKQKAYAKEDGSLYRPITMKKGYYFSFKANSEKLFALYLGKPHFKPDRTGNYPKNIHVFNWELEPLINLEFDKSVRCFDINDEGTKLYISTEGSRNILVYDLDKI
ncbi:MAG: BF3164 family lipoprotein [Thiohalospira sp.]